MTLGDSELTLNGHYVLFHITHMTLETNHKNMNKETHRLLSAARM